MATVLTETRRRLAAPHQAVEHWADEPRGDSWDKVTGQAVYVEDLPDPPGMVHAAALRSPYSHARIVSIDTSKAERLPGVVGVLDREHLDGMSALIPLSPHDPVGGRPVKPGWGLIGDEQFLATDKVRYDGDVIAVVAAVDLRTARRAVELIEVEYELLPVVFSAEEAFRPGAPLLFEELGTNLACEDALEWGHVEQGLKEADHVFEETFTSQNVFHHPMEPSTPSIVSVTATGADVWAPVTSPFYIVQLISKLFNLPAEEIRVRSPYIGGGFGGKKENAELIGALVLSRRIGRPIKLITTAEESFRTAARHAMVYQAKLALTSDGRLTALDVDLAVDTGAYYTGAGLVAHNACISAWGCYRIPHFRVRARTAYTNKVPASHFRSTGKTQTTFGIECALDSVARKMGIDPIAIRTRNVLQRGEYITDVWRVRGEEFPADTPPLDTDYTELMQAAAEGIGWDGRAAPRPVPPDRGKVRGRGLALSLRHGAQGGGRAYAMATLRPDGALTIQHNAPDFGGGILNVIRVVAAHTLGIPQSQVRVLLADTSNGLPFAGTNAQRATVQMGSAVKAACENLKREIIDAAMQAKGGAPEDWTVADGLALRGTEEYTFTQILRAFEGGLNLKAIGAYSYAPSEDKAFHGLDSWTPGVAAAEVEVDIETGDVRLLDYAIIADAGKVLHLSSATGQQQGGAIMGVGIALFEELVYEDGQLQNADPFQYRLPLMVDIPRGFEVTFMENGDGPGPFGAKGVAQSSIPCAAPAIGNAICDAIGAHITSTPFTPEKVLRALGAL